MCIYVCCISIYTIKSNVPPVEQLHHLLPKGHSKVWHVILTPIYVSGKQSATVCDKIFMLSSVTASAQSTVLEGPGQGC